MIRINKNYCVYHSYRMDEKPRIVEDRNLMRYLSDEVRLDKTVTFERLFNLMLEHKDIINLIYAQKTLGNYKIEWYTEEFDKEDEDDDDPLDYLEVYWNSEYSKFEDNDLEDELSCYPSFHGVKLNYTDELQTEPFDMPFGIGFTPINQLKKYKVRIDTNVSYHDRIADTQDAKDRYPLLVKGKRDFSLFDLFEGILYEITYFGLPKDRNKQRDELIETEFDLENCVELTFDEDGNMVWEDYEDDEINFDGGENPSLPNPDKMKKDGGS